MKLRQILIVLSLLTFLSVAIAGYDYYSFLEESTFLQAEKEVALQAVRIQKTITSYLSENHKSVKALAGLIEIRSTLVDDDPGKLGAANAILDHFAQALDVGVCYLIDDNGTTVASSNRNDPDNFVGENFSFRPYWKQAIEGNPATYLALGITSGKRGVYHSYPVYGEDGISPIGVVVIKSNVSGLEGEISKAYEGIVLLTDPNGIIFISNREDWLFGSLRELSLKDKERIRESQQFGQGPWDWVGLKIHDGNAAVSENGDRYILYQMEMENYTGWKLIYVLNRQIISNRLSEPIVRASGPVVLALLALIGLSVFFLYKKANRELIRRREAEDALHQAQEELRSYSRDLERQVKERTREITGILKFTPSVVYIKSRGGQYILVNSRYEELFKMKKENVIGKTDHDLFPREYADRYRENDTRVLEGEQPIQVEETVLLPEGVATYLSVKFPVYDDEGRVTGVCGISTDITDIKKTRDQLRLLSDSIIESQERERTAVSRELHDELGQVLTALRLDSVWLRDRLRGRDDDGGERAQAMCDLIDKAYDEVKSLATRLRPGVLDELGLVEALDWYTLDFQKRSDIACDFHYDDIMDVSDAIATAAYRITQEALTNVARHASARKASVALRWDSGTLKLTVSDDGLGFDPRNLKDGEGLGLAGMRERASLVNGELEIRTKAGHGTSVIFKVDIDIPEKAEQE